MSDERRVAPWPDYAGNPIHEGDIIVHPSGENGRVIFDEPAPTDADRWWVSYRDGYPGRLCLQVGDKGRAVVAVGNRQFE